MRYRICAVLFVLFLFQANISNGQKKLAIIGSSTSACYNVAYTDCYVGRLEVYYNQTPPQDTVIRNFAVPGTNCYNGMPSTYTPPYSDPAYQPNTSKNISYAIATEHPDVIIVNYPTNSYDVLTVTEIMFCLRTIRDTANLNGIPCFVTTSQPRVQPAASFNTPAQKRKMAEIKDSVLLEFGNFALDFWTDFINPSDSSLKFDSGDGVHMNAAGHAGLFQKVLNKNIFLATLPANFVQFNTVYKNNSNIVNWVTTAEADVASYEIQRSGDGRSFEKIASVPANNNSGNNQYRFTDNQPLAGWNYYKVIIVDRDGKKRSSATMSVLINSNGKLALSKIFARSANEVVVEIQGNESQQAELQVLNNMGMPVSRKAIKIDAGSTAVYLQTPTLASGIYHIKLVTAKETLSGSFIKAN